MLFKDRTLKLIKDSVLATKWQADMERKEEAGHRLDLYKDDYEEIIRDTMRNLFCKENYDRLYYHVNQSQNILKRVVNEVSMVYKAKASRTLSIESPRWDEIITAANYDTKLKKINRFTNLLNEVIIKIGVRDGKLVYDFITPNICGVIQNEGDPTKADAIYYQVTGVNTMGTAQIDYYYWDLEGNYVILNENFRVKQTIYTPEDYPFRDRDKRIIIPLVISHRQEPDDAFWDQDSGRDLYNASVLIGVKMTLFDYFFKTASFKQLYAIGSNVSIPDDQILDPLTMIKVLVDPGTTGEVGVLDLQNAIDKLQGALVFQINSIINNYGISADAWTMSISETSGRALKIKNRALLEIREDQLPLYRQVESDLFEKTRIVNNAFARAMKWPKIPENAELSVDFGEIEFPEDPTDELDIETRRLKSGLTSLGKYYLKFNPDAETEEEGEKRIIENLEKLAKTREEHPSLDEALDYIMSGAGENQKKKGAEDNMSRLDRLM